VKVLNNIVEVEFGFRDEDEGRTGRWRIIDEHKVFEKNIYGKDGKKFIVFINKKSQKHIKLI